MLISPGRGGVDMPAARYWRAVGLSAYGGGDVELSALQLYEGSGDAAYSLVSLLLHCDGANGSSAFVDSSSVPKSVFASNGAVVSTAQSKFGGASLSLSSGAFLSVADHEGLGVATGDFVIEMLVYPTSLSSAAILFNKENGTAAGYPYQAYVTPAGGVVFRSYTSAVSELFTVTTASGKVSVNVWTHLAFVRYGSVFSVYVDGVLSGSATYAGVLPENQWPLTIGAYSNAAYPFTGFIDEFRMTKGAARYTGGFSVPSAPFPDSAVVGNAVRIDAGAVLTTTMPPVSGGVAALQDGSAATKVRLAARAPGLALVWDFGAGVQKDVSSVGPGASDSQALFLAHFDLQYSGDGVSWSQLSTFGRFAWPGPNALVSPAAEILPLLVPVGRVGAAVAASGPVQAQSSGLMSVVAVARDVETGGVGRIFGTTKAKGAPSNLPTKARVVLLHQRSKLPVREVWSDPITGDFAFEGIDTRQEFLTLAEDAAGNFRPVAASRLVPEVAP